MKLWNIFRFEVACLAGRTSTWLYLAVLLAFTFLMNVITTPGDGVYSNNTFHITAITVIGGLIWLVMAAPIAGEAAARDAQTRMHPLTYTCPVTRLEYLGGRFLAAFAVNGLLILALPVGILLSFYLPGVEQERLLPFRLWPYGSVSLLIALPLAFVGTALQFTLAALSRRVMASYLVSLLLAIFPTLIAVTSAKLFGNGVLAMVLDPVGTAGILAHELQTWTPVEKNTRLVTMTGMFLWNRILWLLVAGGALGFTFRQFRFVYPPASRLTERFTRGSTLPEQYPSESAIVRVNAISVPQVSREFGFYTRFAQMRRIALDSFLKLARNPVGLSLIGGIALVSAAFGDQILSQFGIPLIPTTRQVLSYLTAPVGNINTPWVIIPLLLMYLTGELVWQEREVGLNEMADVSPVPDWVILAGKLLGLGLLIVVWMALLMSGGVLMQASLGYENIEVSLYLRVLFVLQLTDYLLFALLALVIHFVVNQKYIGYLSVLLAYCFLAFPSTFQIDHPLLIFGKDPGWAYTDMRGFGPTLTPWLWFKGYWIAWALLLAVAACLLRARGKEQPLKQRLRAAPRRFSRPTRWVALAGTGLVLSTGGFIFYNTNVLNEYLTDADMNERKAAYERHYATYRYRPQPRLMATRLHVELYPSRQQVSIRAAYTLVNRDTVSIDSIHLVSVPGIAPDKVYFSRHATGVLIDREHSYHIYALKQPLRPGDSLRVEFVLHDAPRGFTYRGTNTLVVDNGTFFTNYDLLPAIGYQRYRELDDPIQRKKYRLPTRPVVPSIQDWEARKKTLVTDQNSFEATVGTDLDEVAVAPGSLIETWTKGNRRYFRYQTDAPIGSEYAILSGQYAVRESRWNGVKIRIYYHPDHDRNITRMLRSVTASLDHYTRQFGPYPYGHITLVERAGAGDGASADAGMIYYGETFALLNPEEGPDGFDLPYYILAHEVAHQWWGMARLTPAQVEGAGVLIEGLAVYSGMQVLKKSYGKNQLQKYVDYLHSAYAMPRSLASVTLLRANEPFLYYRKGGLALHALGRYLGINKVNGALRRVLEKHDSGQLPRPTTLDLYRELHQVTPDSMQYLLHDLFQKNAYWRLKTEHITAAKTRTGYWLVTMQVVAKKVVVDSTGQETEIPMNDWLEIGLYEENKGLSEPLYLRMHRIRSGKQTLRITVPRKPGRGGIDPNHLMTDLRLDDNMMELDEI